MTFTIYKKISFIIDIRSSIFQNYNNYANVIIVYSLIIYYIVVLFIYL